MSTITVVKKNGYAGIAADTLTKWGYTKESARYLVNHDKILQLGDTLIAFAGSMTVEQAIRDYLLGLKRTPPLRTTEEIYRAWLPLHRALKEEYFVNPEEHEEDAVESSRSEVLIANPYGIFGVSAHRSVLEFTRFYSYGSGYEFALGAMYTTYDDDRYDAEEVAKVGVTAGAEFDDGTELPVLSHRVKLRSS